MNFAPHPFSLRQLQYALAVADTLSFRKAAERCHVSQPSLSAQLAQLESALGVQLFERNKQRVLLTPVGRDLLTRASRILLETDDLVDAATRASDPLAGTLRIGVIPTVSPYLLPCITPLLRRRFARLTIAWVEDRTSALRGSLEAGTLDAAIVALEAELGDVEQALIARDPFLLVCAADHPTSRKHTPAKPSELRDVDVLLLDDGHCFRDQALAVCSKARAHELEFRATSLSTLVQMVAGGAGVTLLPALSVATELRRAKLCVRSFAEPVPQRTLALVWRKHSALAQALQQLAALIREAYPSVSRHEKPLRTQRGRTSS